MIGSFPIEVGVLCLNGTDCISFVHGQCTNDVRGLKVGSSCPALVLNAKGQIEFEIRVLRRTNDILVFCPYGLEAALFERFKRYIIFDDVHMSIVSQNWKLIHSSSQLAEATEHWAINRGFGVGFDLLFASNAVPSLETQPRYENLLLARVKAGIPDVHQDNFLGLLPQECGLESAVSYKKGCYIGQEIMARLEARGNTRYELCLVQMNNIATQSEKVFLENREVGQLGAVVKDQDYFLALSVLRRDLQPNAEMVTEHSKVRLVRAS